MILRKDKRTQMLLSQGAPNERLRTNVVESKDLFGKARLFAVLTVKPGHEMGRHEHVGEAEYYLILEGEGDYCDGGTEVRVRAGDVCFCPDGGFHDLRNVGSEPLRVLCLIMNTH